MRVPGAGRSRWLAGSVAVLALVLGVTGCDSSGASPKSSRETSDPVRARGDGSAEPLHLRIELTSDRLVAGSSLSGALVVTNRSGAPLVLRDRNGCQPHWAVVLRGELVAQEAVFAAKCALDPMEIPEGTTRYPVNLEGTYFGCDQSGVPGAALPPCLEGPTFPPLPPGLYRATFQDEGTGLPAPPPVPVRVTAA